MKRFAIFLVLGIVLGAVLSAQEDGSQPSQEYGSYGDGQGYVDTSALQVDNARLTVQLAAAKEEIEVLRKQLAGLQAKIEASDQKDDLAAQAQLKDMNGKITALEGQVADAAKADALRTDDQIKTLNRDIETLKGGIAKLEKAADDAQIAEIAALKDQNKSLQAAIAESRKPLPAPEQRVSKVSATLLNTLLPFGIGSYLQGDTKIGIAMTAIDAVAVFLGGLYLVDMVLSSSYTSPYQYDSAGQPVPTVQITFNHDKTSSFLNGLGVKLGLGDVPLKDIVLVAAVTLAIAGRVTGISGALSWKEDFHFAPLVDKEGKLGAGVRFNY